jgi:hypothetical protein
VVDIVTCDNSGKYVKRRIKSHQMEKSEMNVAIIFGMPMAAARRGIETAKIWVGQGSQLWLTSASGPTNFQPYDDELGDCRALQVTG